MFPQKSFPAFIVLIVVSLSARPALAQITIDGITDKANYNDTAAYRIQTQAGFTDAAFLNGLPVPVGVIFTGSGAVANWFGANGNPGSHRTEQGLFYVDDAQRITLTDSAAIYLAGQLGHSRVGGTYQFNRFLMQRCTTGGEYTGANFTVNDSAFIECPDDTINFVDGDNDGLYLVSGTHSFTNTLFGWTKDDGIDSGGDGVGRSRRVPVKTPSTPPPCRPRMFTREIILSLSRFIRPIWGPLTSASISSCSASRQAAGCG
jgi:hypothetical protein